MQYNREIAVVYTVKEALEKLNYMRSLGFFEHELHIITKNIEPFQSLKMQTEIDVHQAGNVIDKVKGMIRGTNGVKACLSGFYLTSEEIRAYADLIENGAIFIIALHEFPMEKQKQAFKMKDFAKIPRLSNGQVPTNIKISSKRPVKYKTGLLFIIWKVCNNSLNRFSILATFAIIKICKATEE